MKLKTAILALAAILTLSGCNVAQQMTGAFNLTQCKYDYNSISNLRLANMDLSKGVSLALVPQVLTLLTGSKTSVPLDFTVNLDVTNPNQSAAMLHGLQYILSIDDVQFTTGSVGQSLNVPGGGKGSLPLSIGLDLAQLLTGSSKDATVNIVKNFLGMGSSKSNVNLQIRPSFLIGGQTIASPIYIPIKFSFGG